MIKVNRLRKLTHAGWRAEAVAITGIVFYFVIKFYTEGGLLDSPLFVQLNMLLLMWLAAFMSAAMVRCFRKGNVSRDYYIISALLAALMGGFFALNEAFLNSVSGYSPNETIQLIEKFYKYGYFSFALYAFYRLGQR